MRTSNRDHRWVLIAAAALMPVLAAAGCLMTALTWNTSVSGDVTARTTLVTNLLSGVATAAVGGLVAYRRPQNAIGWLFLATGVYVTAGVFLERYAIYGLFTEPGSVQGGHLIASLSHAAWMPQVVTYSLLFLLFPSGRLTSGYARVLARSVVVAGFIAMLLITAQPEELSPPFDGYENKVGIALLDGTLPVALFFIGTMFILTLASALTLVVRFWQSRGDERRQFKWFAFAGALLPAGIVAHTFAEAFAIDLVDEVETVSALTSTLLPIAVGLAIMRYGLYDIDRIINRTLVYLTLSLGLAAVYFALVVGLQEALRPLSGGSDLAIVVTTLIVAALFLPARRRLQDIVDRRFNRRAYDAARTVDAFSARLRQQVELDTLRYELLAVIDETMAPARASMWLRRREGGL